MCVGLYCDLLVDFYSASAKLAMHSAVLAIVNPSVCLCVCNTLALCQNDSSYDHAVFTGGYPMTLVSSWLTLARNSKGNIR